MTYKMYTTFKKVQTQHKYQDKGFFERKTLHPYNNIAILIYS